MGCSRVSPGGQIFINSSGGYSHISNVGNVNIYPTCASDRDSIFFKPILWCGKEWTAWAQLPKADENPIVEVVQKIVLFVPLVIATAPASLVGLIGLFASCRIIQTSSKSSSFPTPIVGSNQFIEKTYDLGSEPIRNIQLQGFGSLLIESADKNSLEMCVEDNLSEFFTPHLQDGQLALGVTASPAVIEPHKASYVLKLASSPENLSVSGSGNVQIGSLEAFMFNCHISGCGKVTVTSGKVESQVVKISGSGSYQAPNLATKRSHMKISGSGMANIQASSDLFAKISGSGECSYSGNPRVARQITGSGRLRKIL